MLGKQILPTAATTASVKAKSFLVRWRGFCSSLSIHHAHMRSLRHYPKLLTQPLPLPIFAPPIIRDDALCNVYSIDRSVSNRIAVNANLRIQEACPMPCCLYMLRRCEGRAESAVRGLRISTAGRCSGEFGASPRLRRTCPARWLFAQPAKVPFWDQDVDMRRRKRSAPFRLSARGSFS